VNHPAEIALHQYLRNSIDGKSKMSKAIIEKVKDDIGVALEKQFNEPEGKREFRLRMSNVGRPKCQLWFEKNDPVHQDVLPTSFKINMIFGDMIEALLKGLLRASGVEFGDNKKVSLPLSDTEEIAGEYDMLLDDKIDDVKSASNWSYDNKFLDFYTLEKGDGFGYVPQLVGYSEAANKKVGGWWVVNKNNGSFKYVSAAEVDKDKVIQKIKDVHEYLKSDAPFERCFTDEPESYRGVNSGNYKLPMDCNFCSHKAKCWPTLKSLPSKVYKGKREAPIIHYTRLKGEY
tara:strand:+ start:5057 stop:5920 length:864 start_codon:yes stop_codon:yes gene_type:complete